MMNRIKHQDGMTAIGWLLLLAWIITISLPAIKLVPIYVNSLKVNKALKTLKSELYGEGKIITQGKVITPTEIKKMLFTQLNSEMPQEVIADEIMVSEGNNAYNVRIKHHFKEQMLGDWYIILMVDESVDLPIP